MVTVSVNLRRAQADFLDRLAQQLAVGTSQTCCRIVGTMMPPPDAAEDEAAQRAAAETRQAAAELAGQPPNLADGAGRTWTKRRIELDPSCLQMVERLAEQNGESLSRTLRHVIAAFMKESGLDDRAAGVAPASGSAHDAPRIATGHRSSGRLISSLRAVVLLALIAVPASGIAWMLNESSEQGPTLISAPAWADQSAYILFDHHTHTTFSDGTLEVAELVDLARKAGCNAIAISDHADADKTLSAAQFDALRRVRRRQTGFLLFGGVEINMPSYGKREHVTVIVPPDIEEAVLPSLRGAAETSRTEVKRTFGREQLDNSFLELAASYQERGDRLVMIYNHPSREDKKALENYEDITRWNANAPLFIGFAGAPGHQNAKDLGSYKKPLLPIDRWDPVVAEVGGTWDRLLSEGYQLWGAIAGSDFHNTKRDKIPCNFSRTHVAAPGFTYEAILDALRAGTFWADHGRILQHLSLSAEIDGLTAPVFPGSVVSLGGSDKLILARLDLERGPGAEAAPLTVEFIGNCRTGETETLAAQELPPGTTSTTLALAAAAHGTDRRSCFLRARVRRVIDDLPDLMAYTNPIRFVLR